MKFRHLATTIAATTTLALVGAAPALAQDTILIQPDQVPTTAEDFSPNDECDEQFAAVGIAEDKDGWHFVAPGQSSFEELTLTFTDLGGDPVVVVVDSADPGNPSTGPGWAGYFSLVGQDVVQHAWVVTDAGWTLVAGTAEVDDQGQQDFFVLSHTCAGVPDDVPPPGEEGGEEPGEEVTEEEVGEEVAAEEEEADVDAEEPVAVPTAVPAGVNDASGSIGGLIGLLALVAAFAVGGATLIKRRFLQAS